LIRYANSVVLTLSLLSSSSLFFFSSSADAAGGIVINEVAYRGTSDDVCNGEDWVELANTNGSDVDLTGYVLHDDKGPTDEDATTIGGGITIPSQGYILMCRDTDFAFGIGGSDTVTLLDPSGQTVDSVSMAGDGPDEATYARIDGEFKYTTETTPGADNVLEEPVPLEELQREAYAAADGLFGPDEFGGVIDIDVTVDEEALAIIKDHPAWEEWVDFKDLKISRSSGAGEDYSGDDGEISAGKGQIRVKGQSTNTVVACLGVPTVPFNIEFATPLLGMEKMYLRNHLTDASQMRDAMAHYMLKSVGLPYARTKPARLFMNGEYVGFYTLMEAPVQGHVLQNSFGAFDPQKTGIFKLKTGFDACPFDDDMMRAITFATESNPLPPDVYYFERGRHKADTPILGSGLEGVGTCVTYFFNEVTKEILDVGRYYFDHGQDCAEILVESGRVDRDYGPKSIEVSMENFLEKYFDKDVDDLNDFIDTDQWIQNFAFMGLILHHDSVINNINNWYLATTNGGEDWKIVQYDHNSILKNDISSLLCDPMCGGSEFVYWSILRPTCGPIEDHQIVGRVLNNPENMEKYLSYVREYLDILSSDEVLGTIKAYGETIKDYAVKDPLNFYYETAEAYESFELGEDTSDYSSVMGDSFYKTIRVRFAEVRKQLEAIDAGTMPGGGEYDPLAKCPDWRDPNGGIKEVDPSGTPVESDVCGSDILELGCAEAGPCFNHDMGICQEDGTFSIVDCEMAAPGCAPCYPNSRCGGEAAISDVDESAVPVESDACGSDVLELGCAEAGPCFNHAWGICLEDGTFSVADCEQAALCAPCYPNSRCGSGESSPEVQDVDESAIPVESDACGPELLTLGCSQAGPCFENGFICQEDGSFSVADCEEAAPCAPCFPKSKCGSSESTPEVEDEEDEPVLPEVEGEDDPDANIELPEEELPEMESVSAVSGTMTRGIVVAGWLTFLSGLLLSGFNVA